MLDILPHYDYQLESLSKTSDSSNLKLDYRLWFKDIRKLGLDFSSAFILVLFFWPPPTSSYLVYLGAGLAILPDGLHFLDHLMNWRITNIFTSFHQFFHTSWRLNSPIWGLFWQILIVLTVLIFN